MLKEVPVILRVFTGVLAIACVFVFGLAVAALHATGRLGTESPSDHIASTNVTNSNPSHLFIYSYLGAPRQYIGNFDPGPALVQANYNAIETTNAGSNIPALATDCPAAQTNCVPVYYFDPEIDYSGGTCSSDLYGAFGLGSTELAWTHTAAPISFSNRMYVSPGGNCGLGSIRQYPNMMYSVLQTDWAARLTGSLYPATNRTFFRDDEANNVERYGLYAGARRLISYEYPNDAALWAAEGAFDDAMNPTPLFINALGGAGFWGSEPDEPMSQLTSTYRSKTNSLAAISENCLTDVTAYFKEHCIPIINTATQVYAQTNMRVIFLESVVVTRFENAERRQLESVIALSFVPVPTATFGRTGDWEALCPSNSSTCTDHYPEEDLYFQGPVQTMGTFVYSGTGNGSGCGMRGADVGGVADLLLAGSCSTGSANLNAEGVYRREFTNCAFQSAGIGACAVVWNPRSTAYTIGSGDLTQSYGHYMTFNDTNPGPSSEIGCGAYWCDGLALVQGAVYSGPGYVVPAYDALILTQ